jgi:transposase-like protein
MNLAHRGTTLEQRLEIWQRAQGGQTDPLIARAMTLSPMTVRKWRRRAQRHGRSGLASVFGRPATGALSHTPAVRDVVRRLRREHPGWGPQTLRCELERQDCAQPLPHRSRIAAFLHAEGLCRRYQHRSELPQSPAARTTAPHDLWQMDAQGVRRLPSVGRVALINLVDTVSRVKPASYPAVGTGKPSTLEYQLALRCAFVRYGLPLCVSLDHDTVFHDTRSPSPYPTVLHLWFLGLGIAVQFIRKHCPQDHGQAERNHQTIERQALTGQSYADQPGLWVALQERLDFLNHVYPSRALGGQAPLAAYPQAQHSGRWYRPEWEEDLLDLTRIDDYLAQGTWYRWVDKQGQFYLGDYTYGLGKTWREQQIEITFAAATRMFACRSDDGQRTAFLPAQGLTRSALMGELSPLVGLPYYQPMLAFEPSAWRQQALGDLLRGTT